MIIRHSKNLFISCRLIKFAMVGLSLLAADISFAAEDKYLPLAIEAAQESVAAGKSGNEIAMLDNLESSRDFAVYAQQEHPSTHLKLAIDSLGEAISHVIASHIKDAVKDANEALAHLKQAR